MWPPDDADLEALAVVELAADDGVLPATDVDRGSPVPTPPFGGAEDDAEGGLPQADVLVDLEAFASETRSTAPTLPAADDRAVFATTIDVGVTRGPEIGYVQAPARTVSFDAGGAEASLGERGALLRVAAVAGCILLALAAAWAAGWIDPAAWVAW